MPNSAEKENTWKFEDTAIIIMVFSHQSKKSKMAKV